MAQEVAICIFHFSLQMAGARLKISEIASILNSGNLPRACLPTNAICISSRRPDGYGGSDIYVSHRLPNGRWTEPENLGPTINTAGDETTPFIHADNQTLYFTSNGHAGYGGDDLFLTKKGPKGVWCEVENLGFPINTIENEGSLL